jgi:hypothetical protein
VGWYTVVKTIKGHRYEYLQRTWREGKKVRTESRYIGPAGGAERRVNTTAAGDQEPGEGKHPQAEPAQQRAELELSPALVEEVFATLVAPCDLTLWSEPWDTEREEENSVQRNEEIDRIVAELKVKIRTSIYGASYTPTFDVMTMPPEHFFADYYNENATQAYYAVLLHELAHWTGHRSRLSRLVVPTSPFSEEYAYEELVAEATATILLRHFNIAPDDISVHAAYFHSWYDDLVNKKEALDYAKREAQRAAQYILGII